MIPPKYNLLPDKQLVEVTLKKIEEVLGKEHVKSFLYWFEFESPYSKDFKEDMTTREFTEKLWDILEINEN